MILMRQPLVVYSRRRIGNTILLLNFVMVSWMHNTATDINDIGREYNPVAFTACVGSILPQHLLLNFLQNKPGIYLLCTQDSKQEDLI